MFGSDRTQMRRFFTETWRKAQSGEMLVPLEQLLAGVIQQHPEYHPLIESADNALDKDFLPDGGETNPFLHMGMHISLQEQIGTDRPAGIRNLYQKAVAKVGDSHEAEHQMMECLGKMLWEAQRENRAPDEQAYLHCVKQRVTK
ncbi:DUF1841 family protein [Sedimenticola selenatireducens]|uniref:DUF1841 family protein n=1 Tax=Sedimenticola selenatireducens TaxID=191960 RepID=A0A557SCS0_9GAMM|nr:DUF1841 family protein [Sedimenticola selenatireducens]TVO75220.1 DUF1841 family protein [Sedimenticola selenatireducens]TVT66926.1 MAG: DUF1841 family protein [Sedimenticola selenatireducens]